MSTNQLANSSLGENQSGMDRLNGWTLIVPVASESVLGSTLLRSSVLDSRCELILKRGFDCTGKAYNSGIDESTNEILVFAHQDIYLPPNWLEELSAALKQLETEDPNWGALGVWGMTASGRAEGFVHTTGLGRTLGQPFGRAIEAQSLDELLLIIRRSSGLRFDESLPGFHLYGTDICLQARAMGLKNYIIPAFCVHNSNGIKALPLSFWNAYSYLRQKWGARLPVATPCTIIRKSRWGMLTEIARSYKGALSRRGRVGSRCENPEELYRSLMTRGQKGPSEAAGSKKPSGLSVGSV